MPSTSRPGYLILIKLNIEVLNQFTAKILQAEVSDSPYFPSVFIVVN